MSLPIISPMLATVCREPFDDADWVFEIKHDGFRALAYIDGHCKLISRNGYRFSRFGDLEESLAQTFRGRTANPSCIGCRTYPNGKRGYGREPPAIK